MDDLTQCLYEFLMERRMGLWEDAEYKACSSAAAEQEEQVRSVLSGEQQNQLDRFLDRLLERDCMEKEYLFRAALRLVRELNTLVGAKSLLCKGGAPEGGGRLCSAKPNV